MVKLSRTTFTLLSVFFGFWGFFSFPGFAAVTLTTGWVTDTLAFTVCALPPTGFRAGTAFFDLTGEFVPVLTDLDVAALTGIYVSVILYWKKQYIRYILSAEM
jgi:hypothetical protein